jgi:hypothetical protein
MLRPGGRRAPVTIWKLSLLLRPLWRGDSLNDVWRRTL